MAEPSANPFRFDILIAGAGLVGLAAALALKRETPLRLAIADPAPERVPAAGRAYTLTPSARAALIRLGLWEGLSSRAEPVIAMRITDSRLHDPVRAPLLHFAGDEGPLAYVIGEDELTGAAREAAAAAGVAILRAGVARLAEATAGLEIRLSDGSVAQASLLAAADGAASPTRELAGLPIVGWDYAQTGLVAIVGHSRQHQGVAVQHFLPGGPFAILPMTGKRSSIVWTEDRREAKAMLALGPDDLGEEIERRFGLYLGAIALETPLVPFPIRFRMARRFAENRVALLGDAAHVIHPLAGQGLNLGLEDAMALVDRLAAGARLGLDPGDAAILSAYARDRRAAIVGMGVATDLLNRLFSNDWTPARLGRDFGLGLVERPPALKDFFIRRAAGHGAGS